MRVLDKYQIVTFAQKRLMNPVMRAVLDRGWPVPGYSLLETTGRRSGQLRRTPVGGSLQGDTFWFVSEHGRRSGYVLNIDANPRVRVRIRRRWRTGSAHLMPDDDPRERQQLFSGCFIARMNAAAVRSFGTDLMTVRVDLDPASGSERGR